MKITDDILACEERKFAAIKDCLTEKGRRLWSAAEAISYGRGGVFLVHKATNISRTTIYQGIKEIQTESLVLSGIRSKGRCCINKKMIEIRSFSLFSRHFN